MVNSLSDYFITRLSDYKSLATGKICFGGRSQTPDERFVHPEFVVSNPV
jgi:hypothetical protein